MDLDTSSQLSIDDDDALTPLPSHQDSTQIKMDRYRAQLAKNRLTLPQLPEMRYEQSYLLSVQRARRADGQWQWPIVLWITFKETVISPLIQGFVYGGLAIIWAKRRAMVRVDGSQQPPVRQRLRRRPFILQARDALVHQWNALFAS